MSRIGVSIRQGYVDLPEGQIHYRTAGDGPPLLLLHIASFSSDQFLDVLPTLAGENWVIAMDRFGHGTSDPPPDEVSVQDLAATTVQFLDNLGVDRVSILGQHTGASEAVEVAIGHPHRVRKLVLASCPDWTDEDRAQWMGQMDLLKPEPKIDGSHMVELWRQRQEHASPATTPDIMNKVVLGALQNMSAVPPILKGVLGHHISQRLPLLKVPTLFMAGEHDYMRPHMERHRSLLPQGTAGETAVIQGAGDFAALERPEEFARIVMEYLAKP